MKIIIPFALLLISGDLIAQSTTPDVISAAGTSFNDGTSQLDWTLGEPVTADLSAGANQLTQGFHQPELLVTTTDAEVNTTVSVFPNPAISSLNIQFISIKECCIVELYTVEGKLLLSNAYTDVKELQLAMNEYPSGNYLLCIKENEKRSTFRISKIN